VPPDPVDTAVLAALADLRLDSIADVIARMRALDAILPDGDGLKWFNFLYLMVTEEVGRATTAPRWADGAWLERLDLVFARLYFEAVTLWIAEPPRCPRAWAALFEARRRPGVARLQFAIAGMNAHINRDLPLAIVRACEATGVTPARATPEHADYERVNALLEAVEARAAQLMLSGLLAQVATGLGRLDDVVAMWQVRKARDGAWTNGEVQWALRGLPALAAQHLAALDRMTSFAGRAVLVPTGAT
jgi:hypothetical protein